MIHVVIDTNVLLQIAAAYKRSPLFLAWRNKQIQVFTSLETIAELEEVLARPKTQRFVPESVGERFLLFVQKQTVSVLPAEKFPRCRDPKDDMVVATAVAAQAHYLITTDKDLLEDPELAILLAQSGIQVVTPAQFLANL